MAACSASMCSLFIIDTAQSSIALALTAVVATRLRMALCGMCEPTSLLRKERPLLQVLSQF